MLLDENNKINRQEARNLRQRIELAQNILLFVHKNPDGDAIGSTVALADYLKALGKKCVLFSHDGCPENLIFLKGSEEITSDKKSVEKEKIDLMIAIDVGDLEHAGVKDLVESYKEKGITLATIDHHFSNDGYGEINIIDSQASSTAEVLYEIFQVLQVEIDNNMATAMLSGILSDTGVFTNGATTVRALEIVAELIAKGGRYSRVIKESEDKREGNFFRFWAKVLSRAGKNDKMKLVYSVILKEDLEMFQEAGDGVANLLGSLQDTAWALIIKEKSDYEIKVSLRSRDERIDVAKVAKFFGGGGHKRAAGFSIRGRLEREGDNWKIL
jgi:bifunctional oligoribonuclease and PAP phosphatase NrnA